MRGRRRIARSLTAAGLALALAAADVGLGAQGQAPAVGTTPGAVAALSGRRLWYVDTGGTGTPVVLLHAASGSVLMWERQLPALQAAGYRVIAFDRVGWGRSELDAGAAPGTAADDLQALLARLRVDRFHLLGTAAGGFVAFDYALSFPERLRSLTVANSIGGVQDEDYLALGRRLRPSPQFEALPVDVRELGPAYRAADATGTARWVELARQSRLGRPLPSPQTYKNRVTFARLETIRVPTLLISGGADLYVPSPVMRLFADRMKGAETLAVPDAGHSTFWEQAELFNRSLLTFLNRY
jgi:pimeloyl-ACP methyl ester carboxylesterase